MTAQTWQRAPTRKVHTGVGVLVDTLEVVLYAQVERVKSLFYNCDRQTDRQTDRQAGKQVL